MEIPQKRGGAAGLGRALAAGKSCVPEMPVYPDSHDVLLQGWPHFADQAGNFASSLLSCVARINLSDGARAAFERFSQLFVTFSIQFTPCLIQRLQKSHFVSLSFVVSGIAISAVLCEPESKNSEH
jgi:hypothetical protein